MGTRNVTIIKLDGEIKLTKYCQWDGHVNSQGLRLFKFIKTKLDLRKLKKNIRLCEIIDDAEIEKIWDNYIQKSVELREKLTEKYKDDNHTLWDKEYSEKRKLQLKLVPMITRDTGASDILNTIQKSKKPIKTIDNQGDLDYAQGKDGAGFDCEYCYEIDLDNKTVKIYYGKYIARDLVATKTFRQIKSMKSVKKWAYDMQETLDGWR